MVLTSYLVFYKIRIALEQIKCSKTKSHLGRRFLASRCPTKYNQNNKSQKAKQKRNTNLKNALDLKNKAFFIFLLIAIFNSPCSKYNNQIHFIIEFAYLIC